MIPPGSRYETSERLFTEAHSYNEFGYPFLEGDTPNLKIKVFNREATFVQLPQIAAAQADLIPYYVKADEGPQWLAYKFLGDAKRWWEIANVNPAIWYPLDMGQGDYIQYPVQQ